MTVVRADAVVIGAGGRGVVARLAAAGLHTVGDGEDRICGTQPCVEAAKIATDAVIAQRLPQAGRA